MHSQLSSVKNTCHDRKIASLKLAAYKNEINAGKTQREAAKKLDIARSTLNGWMDREAKIPYSPSVVTCFESPEGTDFLHRLLVVIQFIVTQVGGCGIRIVEMILKYSGLSHFVASSYETLRRRGKLMEEFIVGFGEEERKKLAECMPLKKITVAEDETFHPEICLVAMEVVSNFILMEKYTDDRTAETWNKAMDAATEGLNVEIFQGVGDEAPALVKHTEEKLGAHHSPDLFHIQNEITKGIGATLTAQENRAIKAVKEAEQQQQSSLKQAQSDLKKSASQRAKVTTAKQSIGHSYHLYDPYSGKAQTAESLQKSLETDFDKIESVSQEVNLKESGLQRIKKARKMIPLMVNTLYFCWTLINTMLQTEALPASLDKAMREILIPLEYLQRAKKKAKGANSRKKINMAMAILGKILAQMPEWKHLTQEEKNRLFALAGSCADVFQRSSSCVEGRNGYLSLRHHGLHHLSDRKLAVLTVIHNFFIRRDDNTTAAERFFEKSHRDMMEYLIQKMPYPPRPGKRLEGFKMAA